MRYRTKSSKRSKKNLAPVNNDAKGRTAVGGGGDSTRNGEKTAVSTSIESAANRDRYI